MNRYHELVDLSVGNVAAMTGLFNHHLEKLATERGETFAGRPFQVHFQPGDLVFQNVNAIPEEDLDPVSRLNTTMDVFPASSDATGSIIGMKYARLDISMMPGADTLTVRVTDTDRMMSDIIDRINARLNIGLVAGDYVDIPIPSMVDVQPGVTTEIELVMTVDNLVFIGQTTVKIHA